jgi:hypothetical protein
VPRMRTGAGACAQAADANTDITVAATNAREIDEETFGMTFPSKGVFTGVLTRY